ncbi:MAG TPA: hypothetical protein VFP57_09030 [Sphingomicrobium sp.]|nr:hypothetical protein [Sphingomicrobium sp.]
MGVDLDRSPEGLDRTFMVVERPPRVAEVVPALPVVRRRFDNLLVDFNRRVEFVELLRKEGTGSEQMQTGVGPSEFVSNQVERFAIAAKLRKGDHEIIDDHEIGRPILVGGGKMADPRFKVACAALERSEQRVQRGPVAARSQCRFADCDRLADAPRTDGDHRVSDGGSGLIVERADGSHPKVLAQ